MWPNRLKSCILGLEVFWPAIVFFAVLIFRLQFPAETRDTCYYKSRGLPSVGGVNFFQSLICTIDNPCLNESSYHEIPTFEGSRIHKLVDNVSPLLTDPRVTGIIHDLPSGIRLMSTLVETLSRVGVKSVLENGIPVRSVLKDSGPEMLTRYLGEVLEKDAGARASLASDSLQLLVNSNLNIIKLSQLPGQSSHHTVETILCSPSLLGEMFIVKDKGQPQMMSKALCRLNKKHLDQLVKLAMISVDYVKTIRQTATFADQLDLKSLSRSLTGVAGLVEELQKQDLMLALDNVFNSSSSLTSVSGRHDGLSRIAQRLQNPEDGLSLTLVQLSRNATLLPLIDHLNQVSLKFESKDESASPIGQTIRRIITGLHGVQYLAEQRLFQIKYRIHDLLKNVEAVKMLMEYHLGIDIETIEAILNSTIDFTDFVAASSIDPNLLCNRTQLMDVLEVPKSPVTNEELVPVDITCHALCTLSIAESYRFTDQILKQLAVRKVIGNLIQLIADGILGKAELSRSAIPASLRSLKAAARAMPVIKDFVYNFTSSLDLQEEIGKLDFKRDGIDLLGTPLAADIIGKTMCGHPLPMLTNEFKHFTETPRTIKINEGEMNSLPSEFCRDGYRQIMRLSGGPVIWAWLKPILAGKVLYAPDNPLTQAIMNRMNGTFSFMSALINVLEDWSQTLSSLEMFYHDPEIHERLQNVQHLVVKLLGQDLEGLFKDVSASRLVERLANSGGVLKIVQLMGNIAQCFELQRFIGFKDEALLEEAAKKYTKSHELIAGVVFLNLDGDVNSDGQLAGSTGVSSLPKQVEYKIRADIDFVPTTKILKDRIWEPGARDHYSKDLGYFRGFVQVQEMIDRAITMLHINKTELIFSPSIHLQQFPYACYKKDKFGFLILALTPVISTVAWIFLIAFLIRDLVLERELHLEEYLRVTGLKASVAWIAWFLLGFSVMVFGSVCGLTIYKMANLIPNSSMIILYLYFIAFSFSIIMYCYLMSCFFRTATIASLSGIVAYLATYLPFMVAITLENEMPHLNKVLSCLSMSTSFCFGIMYLARYETQGVGIQWSNIWQSPMAEDTMNFATAGLMMVLDGCIYFLIAWYISNVHPPGRNGHREPWYFFLLPSYWGLTSKRSRSSRVLPANLQAHLHTSGGQKTYSLEKGWHQKAGMSLHNLYVIYNKGRTRSEHRAVSNLSLDLREGHITTLLGRNGAGKTTTISVLTGQLRPTSGSVFVYGHPVPEEFNEARKLLGYCPQYNVLFASITVREHLRFFASLKGLLPDDQIDEDVDTMLHSTGLWSMQHELAGNLSGGLQRRLCVALAFVGGSKLIILDEPTSSVDPIARRSIWDLIVKQKNSRTVLLTTHHMDEADILSDQVAVIHRGKLLCSGSPLLLRSKYGCGYQLTVSRQSLMTEEKEVNDSDSGRASNEPPQGPEAEPTESDSDRLLAFIKCLIPNATLIDDYNNSEVILALPRQGPDGCNHDYATFFRCLDANIHNLGFGSYGLTSTTLEEVFLTLCNSEENGIPICDSTKLALARKLSNPLMMGLPPSVQTVSDHEMSLHLDHHSFNGFSLGASLSFVDGFTLKFMQLWALLSKRALHAFHDWRSLFCNLLLPCMFIAFAMGMTCIKPHFAPDPILPVSPTVYGPSSTYFFHLPSSSSSSSLSNTSDLASVQILDQLIQQRQRKRFTCPKPREGWKVAKCPIVKGNPLLPDRLKSDLIVRDELCKCDSDGVFSDCYVSYEKIGQPINTENGFVYNLSSLDSISPFLINTFPLFNDYRYGGYSFHHYHHQQKPNHGTSPTNTSRNENLIKVWFDNNGYHSMASYLNALDNAVMRANLRTSGLDPDEYSIVTYSHPFHLRSAQLGDQSLMQRAGDAGIALIILVGFVFIPTSFVFYIVRERTQEEKQLQKIFGVGTILYWVSAIIWDTISIVVSACVCGLVIYAFQLPIYTARLNLPAILVLLMLFGWAMTSLVYLMEKLFSESSIAFMVIYCLSLFVGINTMVMRLLIDVFQLLEVSSYWRETFNSFVLVFPPYALMSGLVDITKNQLFAEIYTLFGQDTYVNPFSMEMLGQHYIYLASEGAILFLLNLIIEAITNSSLFHWNSKSKSLQSSMAQYNAEDCDVAEERRRVTQTDGSLFDILRVIEVSKVFKSMFGTRLAVNNVSFGVPRGECFGLLGVNGAGKTTLFKILTGQLHPTSGETFINNKSIAKTLSNNRRTLGYCPQSDALDMVLTPRQHLTVYARLRGIPSLHRARIVSESLNKFQLSLHSEMPVSALSRGTRRKLCLALAMLGNPSLVLLDEPTSGMDPMSRRCLWQNIQNSIKERRSVLLTSHSMEECDILCSRLAIMVNGRFRCIGSPQYLKHKFGSGYTITLRINESYSNWNEAINYMKQSFPTIILRAHHHNMLEFSLPTNDVLLSDIFAALQNAVTCLHLQDFSVTQTSLDQVFVSFANQQVNDYHHSQQSSHQQLHHPLPSAHQQTHLHQTKSIQ